MPYWRLNYHVVWSTKNREILIDSETGKIIARSIRTTINAMKSIPHAIECADDHVHVAVSIPPSVLISDLVARMKGAFSHAVNQAFTGRSFRWQAEYGILSFGDKALPDVVAYVTSQMERHASNRLWSSMEICSEKLITVTPNSDDDASISSARAEGATE